MAEAPVLNGPTAIATTAATHFGPVSATAGSYAIVRTIHVANTTTAAITFRLSVGTMGTGTAFFYDTNVPAGGALDWGGFVPLGPSQIIQASAAAAGLTLTMGIVTGP